MRHTSDTTNGAAPKQADYSEQAHVFRDTVEGWIYKGELSSDGTTTFGELEPGDKASFSFPDYDAECDTMERASEFFAPAPVEPDAPKQAAKVGQEICDSEGRIGVITEVCDEQYGPSGICVKPKGHAYRVQLNANAEVITASFWVLQPDGSYNGKFWDDGTKPFRAARLVAPVAPSHTSGGESEETIAALFASAPALLAERDALRAALLDCQLYVATCPLTQFDESARDAVLAKCRAALSLGTEVK